MLNNLQERTHCLTRESPNIQRSDGLRRGRKSLLSELSSLVKTAKKLQEVQRGLIAMEDDVNDIIDEMILKAFKIVIKGVRFLDVLEDDRRIRASAISIMATVVEEGGSSVPPTPPADSDAAVSLEEEREQMVQPSRFEIRGIDSNANPDTGLRVTAADGTTFETTCNPPETQRPTPDEQTGKQITQLTQRTSSLFSSAASHRMSKAFTHSNRMSSTTLSHRVSLAGPSPLSTPQKLVSERLGASHDTFLSHLGSFIGRLHLQSQSRPELALAIKLSATSGGDLLVVVDVVCSRTHLGRDALASARSVMYDRIFDLVSAAKEILTSSGSEVDIIMPQDNGRLLLAATGCVKAAGECVQKTKWVIEKIGDFEFEHENGSLGIDLSVLDIIPQDCLLSDSENLSRNSKSQDTVAANIACSETVQDTTIPITLSTPTLQTASGSNSATPKPVTLDVDKPLPDVPIPSAPSPTEERSQPSYTPTSSRPTSYIEDVSSSMASSVSSIRPSLPPLPKLTTSISVESSANPVEHSVSSEGEVVHSERVDILTASSTSSAGTVVTYMSRDSETSLASRTSTRATTPDLTTQPLILDPNTTGSVVLLEEVEDVESKLLAKTYAHELMFNKEGQVTGGSLPALVERLTTHESTPDAMFVSTFFLTFRLFCTPVQLAEALIDRFDYVGSSPDIASPVRLRVNNVFKGWMESHWRADADGEALLLVKAFATEKLSVVLPSAGVRLQALAERVTSSDGSLVPRLVSSMGKTNTASPYAPPDTPLAAPVISRSQLNSLNSWKTGGSCPTILDFEPLEVARQLTLRQMGIFCAIMPEELLGSQWMKKNGVGAPNVKAMTALSTDLSNLVADTILQYNEVKKRAAVIKQWIKVAHQCLELNNYDSLMAIICSLNSSTITRLRRTWEFVSPKRREMLKTLQAIVEPANNNKVLRGRLHDHIPPCLPFLGMFLTDLTFVDIGNPPTKQLANGCSEDGGLTVINFDKHTRTARIIGELQRFQIPYRLVEVSELQDWLQDQIQRMHESSDQANAQVTYYRKSLLLEPRENVARSQLEGQGSHAQKDLFGWISRDRSNTQSAIPGGML